MLPKFLIADNSQEAPDLVYVVHTEKPQCIIQCDMDGFYSNQKIYWIDEEPLCTDDIESLMEDADEFIGLFVIQTVDSVVYCCRIPNLYKVKPLLEVFKLVFNLLGFYSPAFKLFEITFRVHNFRFVST